MVRTIILPALFSLYQTQKKKSFLFAFRQVSGPGWGKLNGENCLDLMALGGLWEREIPLVFLKSERFKGVFSTRTEKREFKGFSGIDRDTMRENGAHTGLISPQGTYPQIPGGSYRQK
ncbi:MAG: hypothetical protein Q8R70_01390 [Methanoregula sp.]|nr:hypothetical protein [Methanoregula sp.]